MIHRAMASRIQRPAASGRVAFTLIEVLVVVAIIALLIAVLLPSLVNAREQARAAVCASRMKECLNATLIQILERNMRREQVSTNFGWAVFSLKVLQGQTGVFTCPNDPDPKPIPAVLVKIVSGGSPAFGTTSAPGASNANVMSVSGVGAVITSTDGVFNRYRRQGGGVWQVDVQDLIEGTHFGNDAHNPNDIDLLLEYAVDKAARSAEVRIAQVESALDYMVMDYRGRTVWPSAKSGGPPTSLPILWMSFGANAAAGLKSVKGNPALLLEAGKPGIFPVRMEKYPNDDPLAKPLRFRHGGRDHNPAIRGADYNRPGSYVSGAFPDLNYQPRERMNVGFLDGHVRRMHHRQLLASPESALWRGTGRGTEFSY